MKAFAAARAAMAMAAAAVACSGGGANVAPSAGTQTGDSCSTAAACYPDLDGAALQGQVACLSLGEGYCTHTCVSDADCCAVPGECALGLKEVCASFESSGKTYCFVSCAASDITADPNAGTSDPTLFCQRWAGATFSCRSTGGGKDNRLFCGP